MTARTVGVGLTHSDAVLDHYGVDQAPDETIKRMRLRYAGLCRACGNPVAAGEWALYDRSAKNVLCLSCAEGQPKDSGDAMAKPTASPLSEPAESEGTPSGQVESGTAGGSARREHERRVAKRDERIRSKHPRIGGLILALSDEPQTTQAWARGAKGEELLAKRLDELADHGVRLLHDRRIPHTRANIDHIAISPAGVFVIDAKRYKGRPHLRVQGGIIRPTTRSLIVGSRDCTSLVAGVLKQVDLVRAALRDADLDAAPVSGMLCFVEADWPLIGGAFQIDGVEVLWPKKAIEKISAEGELGENDINRLRLSIATAFPSN